MVLVLIINLTQPRIMGEESLNEGLSGCDTSVGDCLFFFFFCVQVFCHHAWCPLGPEEDITLSGIGITDSCKAPCGCWEE